MQTIDDSLFTPINAWDSSDAPHCQLRKNAWQRFQSSSLGISGLMLLTLILLGALIGPFFSNYAYEATHLTLKNQPPSLQFWFGTDDLGRDLFTRVWYGARISLCVGLLAALIDLIVGLLWGGIAGFCGGKIDEAMMRFADIVYSLPYLLIVILFTVVLGSGLFSVILAITLFGWITMARIVRGQILLLKEMEYVLAAQALGAGFGRILSKHLLPNAVGPILVTLTLTIPSAIFAEAFLSFLGLGVQAPMASWGTMANEGLPALQFYPWRLLFPAAFISVTMLAFHLIGEGLKATFDKSLQESL
ncbi:putative ABC-type oligopeptide transporter, permease subunit [Candidatus Protochlamydia naegleriophila]|uniref:Putative ABC-type oligopeptide transporter, permease subunit n=1 Tax=Candidatus Protochlamydia naegleriophila TaxID=389348 RepID=A0A0U5JA43_9BACT|nr:ABC transporter permease [Candidatus Protochlamydia naegleriophila]CUI15933.1 putative ABC-type oligopeptide transporter, permease subunit [Candidatus Protochlamydia naegleriophila]